MTGFGKAVVQLPNHKITVEIKSLNSKQMDLATRIPAAYREKELELRNSVARRLERGKADMNVYVESQGIESTTTLNIPLMAAYKKQFEELGQALNLPTPDDWYSLLLRLPDAIKQDNTATIDDAEAEALFKVVNEAVDELMDFRRQEGLKLEEFFSKRIERIRALLSEIPRWEGERLEKIRARIEDGLSKITPIDHDKSRLEQEMIFYIEKLDINEEKQRLTQHLDYFMRTMEDAPGQGKKLGFISQEMGREINTLGSKSNHAEMQKIVVKMKDELEQIKEQVLNVM
jgi:uncharacterized protein (TIGR00255 family)